MTNTTPTILPNDQTFIPFPRPAVPSITSPRPVVSNTPFTVSPGSPPVLLGQTPLMTVTRVVDHPVASVVNPVCTTPLVRTRPRRLSHEEYYKLNKFERRALKKSRQDEKQQPYNYQQHYNYNKRQRQEPTYRRQKQTSVCNTRVRDSKLKTLLSNQSAIVVTSRSNEVDETDIINVPSQSPDPPHIADVSHSNPTAFSTNTTNNYGSAGIIIHENRLLVPPPTYSPSFQNKTLPAPIYTSSFQNKTLQATSAHQVPTSFAGTTTGPSSTLKEASSTVPTIISPTHLSSAHHHTSSPNSQMDPFSSQEHHSLFALSAQSPATHTSQVSRVPTTTHTTAATLHPSPAHIILSQNIHQNIQTIQHNIHTVHTHPGLAYTTPDPAMEEMTNNTISDTFKEVSSIVAQHLQETSSLRVVDHFSRRMNQHIDKAITECDLVLDFLRAAIGLDLPLVQDKIAGLLAKKNYYLTMKACISGILNIK